MTNSKASDPYRPLVNLSDKINLKKVINMFTLSNLIIYYTWKNVKNSDKNNKPKI